MSSLKSRITHQRDTLIARGAGIRLHAERACTRLRHPVVLIPAFLAGVVTARGAPVVLRELPRLTARLQQFTKALSSLHAIVRLIAPMVAVGLRPSSTAPEDNTAPQDLGAPPHRPDRPEVLS